MAKQKKRDRLAQEAEQALAEGMSYGKWKARQFEQNGRKPVYYPEDWEDSDLPYLAKQQLKKIGVNLDEWEKEN